MDTARNAKAGLLTLKNYETLISAIPGGICINHADENFSTIYANQGFYDLIGYTQEEFFTLFPKGGLGCLYPETRDEAAFEATRQLTLTGTFSVKTRMINKEKGSLWVHFNGRIMPGEDGENLIYIVMVDITDQMTILESLEKEQKFNSLISSLSDDAFFDCDLTTNTMRYSKNLAERFDLPEITENYPIPLLESGIVAEESLHLYQNRFKSSSRDIVEEEIHLITPKGEDVWYLCHYNLLFDENNIPVRTVGKMTDITKQHTMFAELSSAVNEEKQFRASVLSDSTSTFEYNLSKNKVTEIFELLPQIPSDREYTYNELVNVLVENLIHPDDITVISQSMSIDALLMEYNSGRSETVIEFRRKLPSGDYCWARAITSISKDDLTGDIKGFTYVKDIHKEKMAQLDLKNKAERDPLTGLFNKITTENLIKNELANHVQGEQHALMIIDIDDFKDINDHLGHLSGDIVLSSLSDKLRMLFRTNDIIGRIGGDEFFVFMKNIPSIEIVINKAKDINKAFKNTYKEKNVSCTISASIGIVFSPKFGNDFETLYKNSDTALYITKQNGKNSFTVYDGETGYDYHAARTKMDSLNSFPQKSFKDNKVEYLFKLLYSSQDTHAAIQSVLELMTDHFNFSRGYIMESTSTGKAVSNTFEWCKEGVSEEIKNLQNVPLTEKITSMKAFYNQGMFILKNIYDIPKAEYIPLMPQGIKSLFQFAIFNEKKFVGYIGFDDCENERDLSEIELDELITVCNVLSSFVVKLRSSELAEKNLITINAVMDNLDNFAYVIDENSFDILFMNQKTKDLVGTCETENTCYKVFRGNDYQCEECPVKGLKNGVAKYTIDVYNKKFKIWTEATASIIPWVDNKKTCLINCVDITKHKQES